MRCPECGEKLDYLMNVIRGTEEVFSFDLDEGYEFKECYPGNDTFYECPHCAQVIAHTEEEAVDLLRPELVRKMEKVLEEEKGGE